MRTRFATVALACLMAGLAVACSNPEADKQKYMESGTRFFSEKKYAEAIVEFRNAVEVDDKSGEARYKLAEAYAITGDVKRAYEEYIRAADLLPEHADVQIMASKHLALAGQLEDARTRITRLLQKHPDNAEGQVLLGNILAGMKDLDGAVTEIEQAIRIDPSRGMSYASLGQLRIAQGDRDAARAAFTKAVAVDPRSVPARMALAMFQLQMGEIAAAEASLEHVLAIEPTHRLANRTMGLLHLASNRVPEAEPYLKAYADASRDPKARFALADYYLRLNRVEDAKATLSSLADQEATSAEARSALAQIEYARGDRAAAHAMLDGVLATDPQHAGVMLIKAGWLLSEGKNADALARVQAAVKAAPDNAAAHYMLGVLQTEAQDLSAAAASFNEVLRLNPRVAAAQVRLSRLQLARGKTDDAVSLADAALTNAPENPDVRLTLASGLVAQRDFARAEPIVASLVEQYPTVAAVHALHGMLNLARNNRAEARAGYERALQIDPSNMSALGGITALDVSEKRPAAARARIEARVAATPNSVPLLLLSARMFSALNEPAKTEQALRRVVAIAPNDSTAYSMLAQLYAAQKKLDAAQTELDAVVRRNPKDVSARTLGAVIAHTRSSLEDAKRRYKEILDLDPSAAVAANNLAWLYAEEGSNLDDALRLALQAAALAPDSPLVQDTLGWVYYKKELPTLAIPPLEKSVAQAPENPTYRYHLALAHAKNGDVARARQAAEAALRLKSDYQEVRDLLAALKG